MRYFPLLLLAFVFHLASCATAPKVAAPSYAGVWEVTINDTPLGTVTGDLTLNETEQGISGTFVSEAGSYTLESVTISETGLVTSFYYPDQGVDVEIDLTGPPSADTLSGKTMGEFVTNAVRKKE